MRKVIAATILLFCAILAAVWWFSEKAAPRMLDIDPARHVHPR